MDRYTWVYGYQTCPPRGLGYCETASTRKGENHLHTHTRKDPARNHGWRVWVKYPTTGLSLHFLISYFLSKPKFNSACFWNKRTSIYQRGQTQVLKCWDTGRNNGNNRNSFFFFFFLKRKYVLRYLKSKQKNYNPKHKIQNALSFA